MTRAQNNPVLQIETTCGSLLHELQIIWDEVGETEDERDKTLLQIEQECLEVYKRKIDQANQERAQLRHTIADSEAEVVALCSAMEEPPAYSRQSDQSRKSLREELGRIVNQLEEMQKRKSERRNQFVQVLQEIQRITDEINDTELLSSDLLVEETDLSLRKLEELHRQLYAIQEEKTKRLRQIHEHLNTLNSLCSVLGLNFRETVSLIHLSLAESEGSRSISNETLNQLSSLTENLRQTKIQRMQKLQDLVTTMLEFWHLMDTPVEEQQKFSKVTCNIAATESEITEPNSLSIEQLKQVEAEVHRLDELKSSKMKELILKKNSELEELCRRTHIVLEPDIAADKVIEAIESGNLDPESILGQIECQAAYVKEEALSRRDILEKVEKWLAACEEENWLEEYNQDENRYNAGKGSHLILKRAEKARALVYKLPGMVEALLSKTSDWESERGAEFLYDGTRLLTMLEDYLEQRQEKEQERRRKRDQKKLQGQMTAEQEAKTTPSKTLSTKKTLKVSKSKKFGSEAGASPQTPRLGSPHSAKPSTLQSRSFKRIDQRLQNSLSSSTLSTGRGDDDDALVQ